MFFDDLENEILERIATHVNEDGYQIVNAALPWLSTPDKEELPTDTLQDLIDFYNQNNDTQLHL